LFRFSGFDTRSSLAPDLDAIVLKDDLAEQRRAEVARDLEGELERADQPKVLVTDVGSYRAQAGDLVELPFREEASCLRAHGLEGRFGLPRDGPNDQHRLTVDVPALEDGDLLEAIPGGFSSPPALGAARPMTLRGSPEVCVRS
jgi:hypothetical protein